MSEAAKQWAVVVKEWRQAQDELVKAVAEVRDGMPYEDLQRVYRAKGKRDEADFRLNELLALAAEERERGET